MTDIKFDKRNYRKHNDTNKELIKKSLKECGTGRSIIIDADNEIIGGNGVYEQAQKLKIPVKIIETDGTELIAVKRTDLKTGDEKRKQLAVMDNSASDSSEFDLELLQEDFEIDTLNDWGVELEFDSLDNETEIIEDEVPEEVETRAKLGDIWQLGKHRLMCGDSTNITDVEKLMNGVKADMVFTDPPYNVDYVGKTKDALTIQNDSFKTDEECGEKLWLPAFTNLRLVANDCCSYYCCMPQGGTHMMMMMMMMKAGWQVKHEIIWKKQSIVLNRADYNYQHEPILYGWNVTHKFYGKGKFHTTSIWEYDRPTKSKEHPTMKPIELICEALENSSKLNDKVLDLFGGSGSTLIACEQLNRQCYMMELDAHYVDVIIQRWENLTGEKAVLLNG